MHIDCMYDKIEEIRREEKIKKQVYDEKIDELVNEIEDLKIVIK